MKYLIKWNNIPLEEGTWKNDQFVMKYPRLKGSFEVLTKVLLYVLYNARRNSFIVC